MSADPHHLGRFLSAQQDSYADALRELRGGYKRGHWMWFIFPQIEGLGHSDIARWFAIQSLEEAAAYLAHPVLGARLIECCEALLRHPDRSARAMLGTPDDLKLRSCVTLFDQVLPRQPVFQQIVETFFLGRPDPRTLMQLGLLD
jgi:uncharacterized protein (DUF1810 family)